MNRLPLRLWAATAAVALVVIWGATPFAAPQFLRPSPGSPRSAELSTAVPTTSRPTSLPFGFEANQGQAAPEVRFLARGGNYPAYFMADHAVLGTPDGALRLSVVGARPAAHLDGADRLPGVINDLSGDDPSRWHRGIPTYGSVSYDGVLNGIDLVFHSATQESIEYDFVVAPGADPSSIALQVDGAKKMALDGNGDLLVHTATGVVRQHQPVIFQNVDGRRRQVSGGYRLEGADRVAFQVRAYDRAYPLVIDPTITFTFKVPGGGLSAAAVAVDATGHAYVAGTITAAGLAATFGTYKGGNDTYVAKLNPSGTALDYVAILGGTKDDTARAITVDPAGRAYVAGMTSSTNLPMAGNGYQQTSPTSTGKTFVTVLDAAGGSIVYSTYLGKPGQVKENAPTGIALDPSGKVYVAGTDIYADVFPTTPGALDQADKHAAYYTGYLVKLDVAVTGTPSLVWGTLIKDIPCAKQKVPANCGQSGTFPAAVAVDADGFAYLTGSAGCGYYVTPGVFDASGASGSECGSIAYSSWVTKFNQLGTGLVYSTRLGPRAQGSGTAIAVDKAGNAYVTGTLNSTGGFPTAGTPAKSQASGSKGFFSKISPDAHTLTYSTFLDGDAGGAGIALDASGQVLVAGAASPAGFVPTDPIPGQSSGAFLTKYDPSGQYSMSSLITGAHIAATDEYVGAVGLALDPSGAAYLVESDGTVVKVGALPVVSGASPASGPSAGGTVVAITGTGFTGASSVRFGSDPPIPCGPALRCQPDVQSPDTTLYVTTGPHPPGTAPISVTNATGSSNIGAATPTFTWNAPRVDPLPGTGGGSGSGGGGQADALTGPATGGTAVTFTGSDLQGAAVDFGGAPAATVTVAPDGSSVTATTPARESPGPVDVTLSIPASGATATIGVQFTYVPAITGVLPATGRLEGGDQVLIVGEGFTGATEGHFGADAPGEFIVISHSQIAAKTPPHPVAEDVAVTVRGAGLDSMAVPAGANLFSYAVVTPIGPPDDGSSGGLPVPGSNVGVTPAPPGGSGGAPGAGLSTAPGAPLPLSAGSPSAAGTSSQAPLAVASGQLTPAHIQTPSGAAVGSPGATPATPGAAPTAGAAPTPPAAPSASPGASGASPGVDRPGADPAPHYLMSRADDSSTLGAGFVAAAVMVGFSCVLAADRRSRRQARPQAAPAGVPTGRRHG